MASMKNQHSMKNVTRKRKMNRELRILCLIMIFIAIAAGPVNAQEPEEKAIEEALSSYGLEEPKVSISGNEVVIEYKQPVSEFSTMDGELRKIANILDIVSDELSNTYLVKIQQRFDDGQIMEIIGKPEDGKAFLSGHISTEIFWLERLEFKPLTRGRPFVPGICEPDKGENCENSEKCACYPNEICEPDNPEADAKGCVEQYAPPNSHLVGSEYVCDDGYEWNSDLTGCVPEKKCPSNSFEFQGECYCNLGYEWDSDGVECILKEETTNTPPTASFSIMPENPEVGDYIVVASTSSDPDGHTLTYSWYVDGVSRFGNSPNWEWENPEAGEHTIKLVVEDSEGGSDEHLMEVNVRKGLPPQQLLPIPLLLFATGGVAGLALVIFLLVTRRRPAPAAPPVTQPEELVSRRPPARPEGPPERLGGGKPS
ncbi:MAG: PKD domain-containing protein, partial [Deltaproteobacteria bacterium]|nr:PKD domain-containing protein [Deltaproteobacteria bacterium]